MELSPTIIEKIARIESAIRRDPGKRGLLRTNDVAIDDLGQGELTAAAISLRQARQVAILTGFFIPQSESTGSAETDGPLGSALLGQVLSEFGIPVEIITDPNCENVVRASIEATRHSSARGCGPDLLVVPQPSCELGDYWSSDFGRNASHVVSIERVGPSFQAQDWVRERDGDVELFARLVPLELQNRCYNMRGVDLAGWTCGLHDVFEDAPKRVTRIGVGDGGNELGMGRFGWQTIYERLASPPETGDPEADRQRRSIAARIPCRVSADHTIIAGVSNWGADALAAVFCLLRGDIKPLQVHDQDSHERILNSIVTEAGAVDGATKLREPTVDGLPFITYIQTWNAIREIAEADELGMRNAEFGMRS